MIDQMPSPQFEDDFHVSEKTRKSLDNTDAMSAEMRACVHEFGAQIVETFLAQRITNPNQIRSLVHSCWMGAREPHQRHGLRSKRSPVIDSLDWLLQQQGAAITAATLLRVLRMHGMVILPMHPSTIMVEASMATISDFDVKITKRGKHESRLRAAIEAGARKLWPQLFDA